MSLEKDNTSNNSSFRRIRPWRPYLCEKSEIWIKSNLGLLEEAKENKKAFADLIQKLRNDASLQGRDKVNVYKDICMQYWIEPFYMIGCSDNDFEGQIFECQRMDF